MAPEDTTAIEVPLGSMDSVEKDEMSAVDLTDDKSVETHEIETDTESESSEETSRKHNRRWPMIGLLVMFVIAVGLAVGLGIGLTENERKSSNHMSTASTPDDVLPPTTEQQHPNQTQPVGDIKTTSLDEHTFPDEDPAVDNVPQTEEQDGEPSLEPLESSPPLDTKTKAPIVVSLPIEDSTSWPELVGRSGEDAKVTLETAYKQYYVQIVEYGGRVTKDIQFNRIRLFLDQEGNVTNVPSLGR